MNRRILENLTRQHQALRVLGTLQQEEFAHLKEFRPQSVGAVEFSIQELMRQLMAERLEIKRMVQAIDPQAQRLRHVAGSLGEDWPRVQELLDRIDALEQASAKQAEKSYTLALALFDQSTGYVDLFKKSFTANKPAYGPRGAFQSTKPAPAMLRGAL